MLASKLTYCPCAQSGFNRSTSFKRSLTASKSRLCVQHVESSLRKPQDEMSARAAKDPRSVRYWTEDLMPAQDGKVFIVTGASSGLGYYCAQRIAARGGHVIIAARNLERSKTAAEKIAKGGIQGKVEAMLLDLSSFKSIIEFVEEFKKKELPLHVLVENAGVFLVPHDRTQEGFETTVGINYFGHFLLKHLLIDNLKETAAKAGEARIVSMASLFELLGKVRFDDLEGYKSHESGVFEYANSKIMVIMATREINKRLKGTGVEVFTSNPGLVQTPLNGRKLDHNKLSANVIDISTKVYGQNAERASLCLQRPATDPDVKGYGGTYFSPPWLWLLALQTDNAGMREPGNDLARDSVAWAQLYRQTLQIVNQKLKEKDLDTISSIA